MSRVKEIDEEIKELRKQLRKVKGTETEVYKRIVGYYRSQKNFNVGKAEEVRLRVDFSIDKSKHKG